MAVTACRTARAFSGRMASCKLLIQSLTLRVGIITADSEEGSDRMAKGWSGRVLSPIPKPKSGNQPEGHTLEAEGKIKVISDQWDYIWGRTREYGTAKISTVMDRALQIFASGFPENWKIETD
jgi:hypothetical protein